MEPREEREFTLKGVVHDLNNVFQTLLDAADVLGKEAKWKSLSGAIRRSAEHGQRLAQGLVSHGSDLFELEVIADSAIQFARDYLDAKQGPRIDFRSQIEPGLRVPGLPSAWERVLVNLLLNSAQAITGSGQVTVRGSASTGKTEIAVIDSGPGIPPEILPRIFEPMFSTKKVKSGLGLHIVRSIVEQYGGAVAANNRAEGGAEFKIVFRHSQ